MKIHFISTLFFAFAASSVTIEGKGHNHKQIRGGRQGQRSHELNRKLKDSIQIKKPNRKLKDTIQLVQNEEPTEAAAAATTNNKSNRNLSNGVGCGVSGSHPKFGYDDYVTYAQERLLALYEELCANETDNADIAQACVYSTQFRAAGEAAYESVLPDYYYTNYLAMSIAYPAGTAISTGLVTDMYYEALRIHRVLGYVNGLRLSGYNDNDDLLNEAYWSHHDLLEAQDENAPSSFGTGVEEMCTYMNAEYETFKAYVKTKFETEIMNDTIYFPSTTIDYTTLFYTGCTNDSRGYIIQSDWKHHHNEMVSSLMSSACSAPILLYTLYHWESLFEILVGNTTAGLESFSESFKIIAQYYTSPDSFPC